MTIKFLMHKERKEKKENSSAQKQECRCPSLKSYLFNQKKAFLTALGRQLNNMVKATTVSGAKTILI
jgi:hypothetical protein